MGTLSFGIDFFGFLEMKLRDLQGISTLVYELIQNADDVKDDQGQPGAKRISFDIRDDALIVENDGVFRDVDFTRIREIASGGKREEYGTTGAFGIGFLAVYQITDYPELFSRGRHWIFHPEHQEIVEEDDPNQVEGTRFRLPWAFEESGIRRKLRLDIIRREQLDGFEQQMKEAISIASLFLKQLTTLELKRNGRLVKRIQRYIDQSDALLIQEDDGPVIIWQIIRGNFDDRSLRHQYPWIEEKRDSEVLIAIPDELLDQGQGRLFAVLPTEETFPAPLYINADFFTHSHRKTIIWGDREDGYQSQWNRAIIKAAAQALADNLDRLCKLLTDHKSLWHLFKKLQECQDQARTGRLDQAFVAFWDEIRSRLRDYPVVLTSRERWVTPAQARLVNRKVADEETIEILEELGIPIVHPDLIHYHNLLQEVGTRPLSMNDLATALKNAGLDQDTPLEQAPEGLRSIEAWERLWDILDFLAERPSNDDGVLLSYSIALDTREVLRRPTVLFQGNEDTQLCFPEVHWLNERCDPRRIPGRLVKPFGVRQAIEYLSRHQASLEEAWRKGDFDLNKLYRWLESRKEEILSDPSIREQIRRLSIWPSTAKRWASLEALYIPAGFDDPLQMSHLIDLKALGGRKEFLQDLGAKELTFKVYVREQVPRVLQRRSDLPADARRRLVQLLARELGQMRDEPELQRKLHSVPLVECIDGTFRAAHQVYMYTLEEEVKRLLGRDRVDIASPPVENEKAIRALYEWLDLAQEFRPRDVIDRIKELTVEAPNGESLRSIEAIFEYLAERWEQWSDEVHSQYEPLQKLAWLPSNRESGRWYRPNELYASFRRHLFETQAAFLAFPARIQQKAALLIQFLKIKVEPSPDQVVRHLIICSQNGEEVSKEVYRFLNNKAADPSLNLLKNTACLLLPDGRYVRPDQVFWGSHPFGPFRHQLSAEMEQYRNLLERLEVRREPEPKDFIRVLQEIAECFEQHKAPLEDETYEIVMRCWEGLSEALADGRIEPTELAKLRDWKVIPDPRRMLTFPKHLFFEDRAGLGAKFPLFLENNVIQRPKDAWRAMEAAGVRRLSQAVRLHLNRCENPQEDYKVIQRLKERCNLIDRVASAAEASGSEKMDTSILQEIQIQKVQELVVQYSITEFKQKRITEPEAVPALFHEEQGTLYTAYAEKPPWLSIARELAYVVKQDGEIGSLASGIKEVLSAPSYEEASNALDELGFPPIQDRRRIEMSEAPLIADLGGKEPSPSAEAEVELGPKGQNAEARALHSLSSKARGELGDIIQRETSEASEEAIESEAPFYKTRRVAELQSSVPDQEESSHVTTVMTVSRSREKVPSEPVANKVGGRLRTYVLKDSYASTTRAGSGKHNEDVERAGIERVLKYERDNGRSPQERDHYHEGYDIESYDPTGQIVRYIEVKALSGRWGTGNAPSLTSAQFHKARELGKRFWLYIVEQATSANYRIYCIQDPVRRINQFLFDDGWKEAVEEKYPDV